jgi:hypothetical protein
MVILLKKGSRKAEYEKILSQQRIGKRALWRHGTVWNRSSCPENWIFNTSSGLMI